MKHDDRTEKIRADDFLDEGDAQIRVQRIRSGCGRVSAQDASGRRSGSEGTSRFLEAETVCDASGRLGWRVRIPGGRPLATPAVVDGRVFIGAGFGSHEFYSFDAETGKLLWRLRTKDDGPTAATVAGGRVSFNTESCTVYVADVESGRVVWEEWLGDPLMAQTAIFGATLFMVYPDRKRRHQLAAFDLERGKRKWRTELAADVITAPIVADGSVYAATLDGTVYRIDAESGKPCWSMDHKATSAPWIHNGRLYMSLREEVQGERQCFATEGYDSAVIGTGVRRRPKASSRRKADYLKHTASKHKAYADQDAAVGFGSPPAAAKLEKAAAQLGVRHVASVWAFQGSRPEVFEDGIFCVLDDVAQRLELGTKKPLWRVRVEAEGKNDPSRTLSPPAVSSDRLYFTSSLGDLFVLDRESGEELWALNVGSPVLSQPAVADGKVFLGTADGMLYAFESSDTDTFGWTMWGGGPGHNGRST